MNEGAGGRDNGGSGRGPLKPPLSWVFRGNVGKFGQGQLREELEAFIRRRVGLSLFAQCEEHITSFLIEQLIVRVPPVLTSEPLLWRAISNEIIEFLRKELGRKRPPVAVKALGANAVLIWQWKIYEGLDDEPIIARALNQCQMDETQVRQVLQAIATKPPRQRHGPVDQKVGSENDTAVPVDSESPGAFWELREEDLQLSQLQWLTSEYGERAGPALASVRRNPRHQLAFLAVQLHFQDGKSISAVARMLHSTDYKIKTALNELYDELGPLLGT